MTKAYIRILALFLVAVAASTVDIDHHGRADRKKVSAISVGPKCFVCVVMRPQLSQLTFSFHLILSFL